MKNISNNDSLAEEDLGYRTVQLTGRDSYIISLPKRWVLSNGLKKGSQLIFKKLPDSSLLLIPREILEAQGRPKQSNLKEFTVRITPKDDPTSISRRIMSLYTISADLIQVKYKEGEITPAQKTSIKNTSRMLLGSEIISESPTDITIQILINRLEFTLEKAVRRMFTIAKSMDIEAVSALKNPDEELLREVISSDQDLDRLSLYAIRQLKYGIDHNLFKEMGLKSSREALGYRILINGLENVGDNAVSTAKSILELKRLTDGYILVLSEPIDEEVYAGILKCHSFAHLLLDDSMKAFFKRDYHLADDIISRFTLTGEQFERDSINLMLNKKIDPNLATVLRLILYNSKKMMEYSRDIAEVTLNRTVDEISTL
ncbi:MAG: PhoU domain-containing protein [Nitrososphaeria archaeon]